MQDHPKSNAGLGGLRVVEVSRAVEGAYCARLLADAGAEVIMIEAPGDAGMARRLGPFPKDHPDHERSGLHTYLNSNKLGITLDLETAAGSRILEKLLAGSDVLVTDFPLQEIQRLKLGYEQQRATNPNLIACAITPFGMTGPNQAYRADDIVALSVGGLTAATPGFPDYVASREKEPPLRAETHAAGYISGAAGAVAILEALFARLLDERGRQVDVSQQEAVASTMIRDIASYSYAEIVSGRRTEEEQSGTAYAPNIYLPCKDGMIILITASEDAWKKLVKLMGGPAWAGDPAFKDSASRARNIRQLVPLLVGWTMTMTGEEFTRLTQANGLPCAHVLRIPEMVESRHVSEREALVDAQLGDSQCRMPGPPFRIKGMFGHRLDAAPRKGEHNHAVLCERLGYTNADLVRLHGIGVI